MADRPASTWIHDNWDELVTRYNNQWLAAVEGEVLAHSENFRIVSHAVSDEDLESAVFVFLTSDTIQ